jgi:hypothetical protein
MITYVNTVLVSNLASGAVLNAAPAAAASMNAVSADAGKFIIMNCDPDVAADDIYNVTAGNAGDINTIKVGIVTKKNTVLRKHDGSVEYRPIVKWSNEIKAADIKSFNALTYTADTEDQITIDFTNIDAQLLNKFAEGGKRIIVRLTFKDLPTRFRKWTESYEYVTKLGDTKESMVTNIANMINKEYKRARVIATVGNATYSQDGVFQSFAAAAGGKAIQLEAMKYTDDNSVDSINWYNKVRFNANVYFTDPAGEGWESINKHFPDGVKINKVPGKTWIGDAKLVRDREAGSLGYQGIINHGEGTWPIIKPAMATDLTKTYDAITLEFERMYRTADDLQRKTKESVEIYCAAGGAANVDAVLKAFVG